MKARTRRAALFAETLALRATDIGGGLRRGFYRSFLGRSLWAGQPVGLVFDYPPELKPGNAEIGELWLAGDYTLDGGIVRGLGRSPFDLSPASERWLQSLHAFDWLRHLLATPGESGLNVAAETILRWCAHCNRHPAATMAPHVVARRLMSWSAALPKLRDRIDNHNINLLLTGIHAQARWLTLTADHADTGPHRFAAAAGLTFSGLMLEDGAERLQRGMEMLTREIKRQVLPDGGHISRSPERLARLLADMLAIKAGLNQRKIDAPAQFDATLKRMRTLVGFFRLGDGRLAGFNGGLEMSDAELHPMLSGLRAAQVPAFAQRSGYQRVSAGNSRLIVDTGNGPTGTDGLSAHAAPLAFEMSHGADRLIVNCGSNRVHGPDWQLAARGIAAHSTLAFGSDMDDPFLRHGRAAARLGHRLLINDWQSQCRRMEDANGIWLDMSHGLFKNSHGVRYVRRLFVDSDGEDIRGEELLMPAINDTPFVGAPFFLRFHLHPDVNASPQAGGNAILLLTPSGYGWQFRTHLAEQTSLCMEDSVYMGRRGIPQRSKQLVIQSSLMRGNSVVRWGLRYAGRMGRGRRRR